MIGATIKLILEFGGAAAVTSGIWFWAGKGPALLTLGVICFVWSYGISIKKDDKK